MKTMTSTADLNDLVFLNKNKEFGAYFLRKNYDKYLSMAVIFTAGFFLLAISSPVIMSYLNPSAPPVHRPDAGLGTTVIMDVPSIQTGKKPDVEIEVFKELKSTLAFKVPVITPDYLVKEDYIPSQIDLQGSEPGKVTVHGDADGIVPGLIEVPVEVPVEPKTEKPEVFIRVEEMPSFPGGDEALMSYISQNVHYPEIAKRAGVEGRVTVGFVVTSSGSIADVQVMKTIGAGCDEEAARVVRSMPVWNPGKQNGRAVNVRMYVPIVFKLQ